MALAIVQCQKCGAVTPNGDVLKRHDWLLPCLCGGERLVVHVHEHIGDRRWREKPVSDERRRPLPA